MDKNQINFLENEKVILLFEKNRVKFIFTQLFFFLCFLTIVSVCLFLGISAYINKSQLLLFLFSFILTPILVLFPFFNYRNHIFPFLIERALLTNQRIVVLRNHKEIRSIQLSEIKEVLPCFNSSLFIYLTNNSRLFINYLKNANDIAEKILFECSIPVTYEMRITYEINAKISKFFDIIFYSIPLIILYTLIWSFGHSIISNYYNFMATHSMQKYSNASSKNDKGVYLNKSIDYLYSSIKYNPNNMDSYKDLEHIYTSKLEDYDRSIDVLNFQLSVQTNYQSYTLSRLGDVYLQKGDYIMAKKYYLQAIDEKSNNIVDIIAYIKLADLYEREGNMVLADKYRNEFDKIYHKK